MLKRYRQMVSQHTVPQPVYIPDTYYICYITDINPWYLLHNIQKWDTDPVPQPVYIPDKYLLFNRQISKIYMYLLHRTHNPGTDTVSTPMYPPNRRTEKLHCHSPKRVDFMSRYLRK